MNRRRIIGFVLLMVLLVLAHLAPHEKWYHAHESNNMMAAWLVSKGWVLYQDFAGHHLPFPFYLPVPLIWLFGPSQATFHATLLGFYILALALLLWLNRRSARPFSFGLFVLFIALGHVLYMGHLYLYDSLLAFALLLIFYQFWRFDDDHRMGWLDWALVGLAIFVALGSTLAAAYPLLILSVALAIKHFRIERRNRPIARAAGIAVVVSAPIALMVIHLWARGLLRDFWEQVYEFNAIYYRTDTGYGAWESSSAAVGFLIEGLRHVVGYFFESLLLRHGPVECLLGWTNVGVLAMLIVSRRRLEAVFYAVYVSTLMLRVAHGLSHAAPYQLHSLWAAAWLLQPVGERLAESFRAMRDRETLPPAAFPDILRAAGAALLIVLLAQVYLGELAEGTPPETPATQTAELCAKLTSPVDRIGVLPCIPEIYMQSDRLLGLATFAYYPWLDRWGKLREAMVESVENQRSTLLVLDWWQPETYLNLRSYGEELRDAIRRNYQPLTLGTPKIYVRNASFHEVRGRYERVRSKAVLETPESNLVPVPVYGAISIAQQFSVSQEVSEPKLGVLVSAPRRSDTWAKVVVGTVDEEGRETVLVRKQFRTALVRYFRGVSERKRWWGVDIETAGDLQPGNSYFFRVTSPGSSAPDVFQVWTAPKQKKAGMGETYLNGEPFGRTFCFQLHGETHRAPSGNYPIVEQSLARTTMTLPQKAPAERLQSSWSDVAQVIVMPETTTISAVSLLLDPTETQTSGPYHIQISTGAEDAKAVTREFTPPRANREWVTIGFPPRFVEAGKALMLEFDSAEGLCFWTAGTDVLANGLLLVKGERREDDLCLKVYASPPRREGLPDMAVTAVDFGPADPLSVAPEGPLQIQVRVENRGTSPTGPFWVEFFAQRRDLPGPLQVAVKSFLIPNLPPGHVYEETLNRTLYPLRDGLYGIVCVVDRLQHVYESDEENNRLWADDKNLLVVGRKTEVNLAVTDFGISREPIRRGKDVELRGRVSNSGKVAAGRFTIELWAAPNPNDPALRFAICEPIVVETLGAGNFVDLTDYPRTLRAQMPTGRLYVGCTVDPRDAVHETRTWDNTAHVGPVTIQP